MRGGPYRLGLTGSIGMGKSTTAQMFRDAGIPVWDADAAVHRLYARQGAGANVIAGLAPQAVVDGAVDRNALRSVVVADPAMLPRIEAAIHPLVAADRARFLAEHRARDLVVFDIPLLFETGAEDELDGVLVISAAEETQRSRVLARPGMTEEALERIVARQTPDAEKRRRADHVIETDFGPEPVRTAVLALIENLTQEARHA